MSKYDTQVLVSMISRNKLVWWERMSKDDKKV